jgi:hypothetical protein
VAETFVKLFGSIIESTIWCEDSDTRIVWITMLAMADAQGYVGASLPGLAARAQVPMAKVQAAIEKFLSPDAYSRSKDFEGRRIEEAERGWRLLNYLKFREQRDAEARREYERERKRGQRSKPANDVPECPGQTGTVPQCPPLSAQEEEEVEEEGEKEHTGREYPAEFVVIWEMTGKRGSKFKAWKAWRAVGKPDWTTKVQPAWNAYMLSDAPSRGAIQYLATWFNGRCHEQEWQRASGDLFARGSPSMHRNPLADLEDLTPPPPKRANGT